MDTASDAPIAVNEDLRKVLVALNGARSVPQRLNIGVACTDAHLGTAAQDRVAMIVEDDVLGTSAITYRELADRTDRIDEAYELVAKALKLSPEDPFLLDSLGWVQYRRGNLEDALKSLRLAYDTRPDPEIAAHLGEVLWKLGRKEEASKVWKTALVENPGHETLLAVIQKFQP
mgnify:CR=1 FL=1